MASTEGRSVFFLQGGITDDLLSQRIAESRGALGPSAEFDFPATLRGKTTHFEVYYDPSLGTNGTSLADAVLSTCEQSFAALKLCFGRTPGRQAMQVVIAPLDKSGNGMAGAYHYGCSGLTLYCDAKWLPSLDVDFTQMLMIAEEVEVFEDAQNKGWNCGWSNGEGLSRVLAQALYPKGMVPGALSAPVWLDSSRPNFVSVNDNTDLNPVSAGCAVLFLNYLHAQLRYSWPKIVKSVGATLEKTYHNLSGKRGGFASMAKLLNAFYAEGSPSKVSTDNPFPLGWFGDDWGTARVLNELYHPGWPSKGRYR